MEVFYVATVIRSTKFQNFQLRFALCDRITHFLGSVQFGSRSALARHLEQGSQAVQLNSYEFHKYKISISDDCALLFSLQPALRGCLSVDLGVGP